MKRPIVITALVLGILAATGFIIYSALPPNAAGKRAVEQLSDVHTFSLGPVGYAGSTSDAETAFFTILSSRHSPDLFRDLYERGTSEAKLYALCGLHLTHGNFDLYATRFIGETTNVSTMGGCIRNNCTSQEAIAAIKQGALEQYLLLRREIEQGKIRYENEHKSTN